MIPGDLASRLRMLGEAGFLNGEPNLAPLARIKAISGQLPDFTPGERIIAHLEAPRPDNTAQARIDGREVILALSPGVKAGDVLELVVTHVSPQAVLARLATNPAPLPPTPGETITTPQTSGPILSQAGRLISYLLAGPSGQAPEVTLSSTAQLLSARSDSAPLAASSSAPLLATPPGAPQDVPRLAGQLAQALGESGLFYEAHQARWLAGQTQASQLLQEPQGRLSPLLQLFGGKLPDAATLNQLVQDTIPKTSSSTPWMPGDGSMPAEDTPPPPALRFVSANESGPAGIPERLVPLVHQQLDSLATHQVSWQGQIWPGQMMEWEIEDPETQEREAGNPDEPAAHWNSTLRLTLPGLGQIEARLQLTPQGVALRLVSEDENTRQQLQRNAASLEEALAAANVPLTGLVAEVRRRGLLRL